jgi:O-antigen/teichoic acid export membrane protein
LKFIKDILITFSTQIAGVAFDIGVAIIIARALGAEGKGAYSLIVLVAGLLALLGNLGIGTANIYFGGSRKHDWTKLASNSLVSAVGLGVLLAVGFLAYLHIFQPSFLRDIDSRCLVLATLVLPLSLLVTYFTSILLGQSRIKEYNLVQLAQSGVFAVLVLPVLLAVKGGVFGTIAAWASAVLVAAILSILLVRRTTNIKWSFHRQLFKDSVKFGVQGYLGGAIQFLNYRLNMLLVALFMNVTFVGYYSISVTMAEALWYFPGAVATITFARTSGMKAEEANVSTPRICRNTFFLTVIGALLLFVLGRYIILLLFGSAFLPALKPLWILLPGVVAFSILRVLSFEMGGRGKPIVGTIGAGASLAVNIPLNILLIPRMGISGAALASTISYTVGALVVLVIFLRISKNSWVDTVLLKREDLKIYRSAFSTARSLNVKYEATALTKQALSLLRPGFWRGESVGLNLPKSSEQDSVEHQGENTKSEKNQ